MRTVNMHDAKEKFSSLVDAAGAGGQIIITKAGKPVVKLMRVEAEERLPRTGFLAGQGRIPDDFDGMHSQEIIGLFGEDA